MITSASETTLVLYVMWAENCLQSRKELEGGVFNQVSDGLSRLYQYSTRERWQAVGVKY